MDELSLHIDVTDDTIVIFKIGGKPKPADVHDVLSSIRDEYLRWDAPRSVIFDLTELQYGGAEVRRILADWRKKNALLLRSSVYSGAYVISSAIVRGMLTAVGWVFRPPISRVAAVDTVANALVTVRAWEAERATPVQPSR
ncbi:MAG: hypothetical protein AAGE52_10700 [Myxococcota bacterium]